MGRAIASRMTAMPPNCGGKYSIHQVALSSSFKTWRALLNSPPNGLVVDGLFGVTPHRLDPPRRSTVCPAPRDRGGPIAIITRRFSFDDDVEWRRRGSIFLDVGLHLANVIGTE